MAQNKKVTTFYASEEIARYLDALPAGDRSRKINDMLRQAISMEQSKFIVSLNFNEISRLLSLLYDYQKRDEEARDEADPQDLIDWEPPRIGWASIDQIISKVRRAVD